MIKNERQYVITRAQIAKFEQSIGQLAHYPSADDPEDPQWRDIQRAALQSMLDDLRSEVGEFEALHTGRVPSVQFSSLEGLSQALIAARIAAGLTQRELAARLGMKEQQIQRYEATDYESASLARIAEIADALGIQINGTVDLPVRGSRAA
jgi:DNA-binding Xre family transcriptional regulator